MAKRKGHQGKFALGSSKVLGIVSFTIPGINWDKISDDEMGDTIKGFLLGMGDAGEIQLSGQWDPDDTSGQAVLRAANLAGTAITDPRIYPDSVTSYFGVNTSDFPSMKVYVTKFDCKADMSGLYTVDMTLALSKGCMKLN